MDWLTFISNIVSALAWPMVVTILLFLLRPYFEGLTARLESLKLPGGTEAKFREELAKAKVDVQALQLRTTTTGKIRTVDAAPDLDRVRSKNEEYLDLSRSFPEAAIMYSFQEVERVLDKLAPKLDVRQGNPRGVIDALQHRGLINVQLRDLYMRLSNLRNVAVHRGAVNITSEEAIEYRRLTQAATGELRQILTLLEEK